MTEMSSILHLVFKLDWPYLPILQGEPPFLLNTQCPLNGFFQKKMTLDAYQIHMKSVMPLCHWNSPKGNMNPSSPPISVSSHAMC